MERRLRKIILANNLPSGLYILSASFLSIMCETHWKYCTTFFLHFPGIFHSIRAQRPREVSVSLSRGLADWFLFWCLVSGRGKNVSFAKKRRKINNEKYRVKISPDVTVDHTREKTILDDIDEKFVGNEKRVNIYEKL